MYAFVVFLHAAAGTIALPTFWTAGFARKGGRVHRYAGRTFLLAMCVIGATALPMALVQFARGHAVSGGFLSYLLVVTATACVRAWLAIRWKRDAACFYGRWYRRLAAANVLAGAAVLGLGLSYGVPLLSAFSLVGIGLGLQMAFVARRAPSPRWWLREHYRGMLANGVATHVAFLSIGLARLLPAYVNVTQTLAWFGPLTVALIGGAYLRRRYGTVPAGTP